MANPIPHALPLTIATLPSSSKNTVRQRKHGPPQLAQNCEELLTFYLQYIKPVKPQ